MHVIKMILWTSFFIGVGMLLASYPVEGGKTALQHFQHAWQHRAGGEFGRLRERVGAGLEDARDRFSATSHPPRERHSDEDRTALNKLIARRATAGRD